MKPKAVESEIATFLSRYTPEIEAQLREARQRLRAAFPRGFELVFDNYNALVFAISATERAADAFISVAGYPRWVTLFFGDGAALRDPHGVLEGKGRRIRSIRLKAASDLGAPKVRALIAQAIRLRRAALAAAPVLSTVVKSVVQRQRSRRPTAGKSGLAGSHRPAGKRKAARASP